MGLREATLFTVILGMTAAATAVAKPARSEPAKAAKPPAADAKAADAKAADAKAAERPDRPGSGDATSATPDDAAAEPDEDKIPPHIVGPKHVDLGDNTAIDLPEGMVLFERAVAQELLRKNGDPPDGVVAMVFKPGSEWHAFIEYSASGYIDDSDADDLDAGELLDSYRKGTEEQNKTRKSLGKPELFIDSWSELPRYERASHHLVWGLAAHDTDGKVINFFTRILGRNGYLSVDLIDAPERLEASKKEALPILQATHFNPGSTYADHVSSDRSSGIGLRGLVLGGAGVAVASKLGLLAKILLVFKKLFIVIGAAIVGLFRWLFRRKSRAAAADPIASQGTADLGPPQQPLSVDPPLSSNEPPPGGPAST
jgi:uncharacterized membrane-anchored protein